MNDGEGPLVRVPALVQCFSVELRLCVARDAWSSLGNMTKVEAMKNYVQDIQLVRMNGSTLHVNNQPLLLIIHIGAVRAE